MNIQSTRTRMVAERSAHKQQQPSTQTPAQQQPTPPKDSFDVNLSSALETTVPLYTSFVGSAVGVTTGMVGGAVAAGVVGALIGGRAGTLIGAFVGGTVGIVSVGYVGSKLGKKFGSWAMERSGEIGANHNPANPTKGKATGQAIAGGAITFMTGSPLMTALVVGGSAAYAAHKTLAEN